MCCRKFSAFAVMQPSFARDVSPPAAMWQNCPGQMPNGLRDRKKTEQGETFLYSGEIRPLIGALSQAELTDITIAEPDLEEVFLHYYGEEEGAGKGEGEDDGILA